MVRAYNVYLVNLDPTVGLEIKKEPAMCCTFSRGDEFGVGYGNYCANDIDNSWLPFKVEVRFQNKTGEVCLDQLRAVDESRLSKQPLGRLKQSEIDAIKVAIADIFKL